MLGFKLHPITTGMEDFRAGELCAIPGGLDVNLYNSVKGLQGEGTEGARHEVG